MVLAGTEKIKMRKRVKGCKNLFKNEYIKSNYVKEIALKQIQVLTEIETDHSNK